MPTLFAAGNDLSTYGVWAYLIASVTAAAVALVRARVAALPGALLVVVAGASFLGSHIYWPDGVLTMVALAVGWTALLFAVVRTGRLGGEPAPHAARPVAAGPGTREPRPRG